MDMDEDAMGGNSNSMPNSQTQWGGPDHQDLGEDTDGHSSEWGNRAIDGN